MKLMHRTTIVFSFLFILFLPFSWSQNSPKIGLVLSGGGAKGLAHIGVLQVLEEYGIQVDYIGGTSIGAIIGGLYATGYNARQLDSIVRHEDLGGIILGDIPRSSSDIRHRRYDEKTALTLTFDKGTLNIPSGLSNGQQVYDFLFHKTYPQVIMTSFDDLSIPFFCIGTDLLTGEEVVMDKGSLPLALRASASLPTILSPVLFDGKVIVDGGVVNNLPAKEVREKGADIVIGVSVETGLYTEEELTSATNILAQVSSYGIVSKSKEQYLECDLLIKPELSEFGLLAFDQSLDIISRGRIAGEKAAKQLIKIAKAQGKSIRRPYKPREKKYFKLIDIDIDAHSYDDVEYIQSYLPFEKGAFLELNDLHEGIFNLQSTDYFEFIEYNLLPQEDGMVLNLHPTVKRNYQNTFGTAIHYDDFYKASVLIQSKRRDFFTRQDQLQLDLVIGNRIRYDFDYHINRGAYLSPGFRSRFQYNNVNTVLNKPLTIDSTLSIDELVFQYTDFSSELNVALLKKDNTMIELAGGLNKYKIDSDQLEINMEDNFSFDDSWYFKLEGRYYFDNLDSRQFAMTGSRIKAKSSVLKPIKQNIDVGYSGIGLNIDFDANYFYSLHPKFSVGMDLVAGINLFDKYALNSYNFGSASQNLINNFKILPGLSFGQAVGETALKVSPFLRWKMSSHIYLTGQFNALWIGDPLDQIVTSQKRVFGGNLGVGYSSILGPIEFIYGYADEEGEFFVNVGHWF